MQKILYALLFFAAAGIYAQKAKETSLTDDEFYDFGAGGGITIYGERPKDYPPESDEAYVMKRLNGTPPERRQFIQTDFLEKAGFRRTGDAQYRASDGAEKAQSVVSGLAHLFSFGMAPIKPFFETEYGKLPKGAYYSFESVAGASAFKAVSPEVLTVLKLEYMLQIEFCNGVIIQDNKNYWTDEHIKQFETVIASLPDTPQSIAEAKTRFLGELAKIKAAFARYKNPSENQKRAQQNLENIGKSLKTGQ